MIQSFAGLLVCRADWTVQAYSETLPTVVSQAGVPSLDAPIDELFGRRFAHDVRGWSQSIALSGEPSMHPGFELHGECFDIGCYGAGNSYSLTFEPTARSSHTKPDALTRRYLQRLGGTRPDQEVVAEAVKLMRLFLRADLVSLIRMQADSSPEILSSEGGNALTLNNAALNTEVIRPLALEAGSVADAGAPAYRMIGKIDDESVVPALVRFPPPPLIGMLEARNSAAASWYRADCFDGSTLLALSETESPNLPDMPRRLAVELAVKVLAVILDARKSNSSVRR